jgi:hypothetical protein
LRIGARETGSGELRGGDGVDAAVGELAGRLRSSGVIAWVQGIGRSKWYAEQR